MFVAENQIVAAHCVDQTYVSSYERYYATRNIYVRRAKGLTKTEIVALGQDLCSDSELEKSEYYNDYLRPQEIYHSVTTMLQSGTQAAHLGFVRPKRGGYFEEGELKWLESLTPHLHVALRLREKIAFLKGRNAALLEVLDRLPFGVFLVDRSGAVVESHRVAALLINKHDGLGIVGHELAAASHRDNIKLRRSIEAAVAIHRHDTVEPCALVTVTRPSGRRAFVACVVPLRVLNITGFEHDFVAAVFISDSDGQHTIDSRLWSICFLMTPAESRLAKLLVAGSSLKESAERLQVSSNTAKTQLRSIMAKTATHRQGDLVRVLLSVQIGQFERAGSTE